MNNNNLFLHIIRGDHFQLPVSKETSCDALSNLEVTEGAQTPKSLAQEDRKHKQKIHTHAHARTHTHTKKKTVK